MVEGNDANNSLGFATATDCWCFLVFSVRILTESCCKAPLSEWINLKLQHPTPPAFDHNYLVPRGSGEFELEMSTLTSLKDLGLTTWVNRWDLSYSVMEEFIRKGIAFVNGWLVQQQLQKLHACALFDTFCSQLLISIYM